jgi:hypothetical protein
MAPAPGGSARPGCLRGSRPGGCGAVPAGSERPALGAPARRRHLVRMAARARRVLRAALAEPAVLDAAERADGREHDGQHLGPGRHDPPRTGDDAAGPRRHLRGVARRRVRRHGHDDLPDAQPAPGGLARRRLRRWSARRLRARGDPPRERAAELRLQLRPAGDRRACLPAGRRRALAVRRARACAPRDLPGVHQRGDAAGHGRRQRGGRPRIRLAARRRGPAACTGVRPRWR